MLGDQTFRNVSFASKKRGKRKVVIDVELGSTIWLEEYEEVNSFLDHVDGFSLAKKRGNLSSKKSQPFNPRSHYQIIALLIQELLVFKIRTNSMMGKAPNENKW